MGTTPATHLHSNRRSLGPHIKAKITGEESQLCIKREKAFVIRGHLEMVALSQKLHTAGTCTTTDGTVSREQPTLW